MPDWEALVRTHLDLPTGRRRSEDEIIAELTAQLEDSYQQSLASGCSEEEAEQQALALVGDWDELRAQLAVTETLDIRGMLADQFDRIERYLRARGRFLSGLADVGWDVRYALRTFRRTPGLVILIVVTLGLGIGANTAVFGLLHDVLIRPLPFDDPRELVEINHHYSLRGDITPVSVPGWREYRTTAHSFERMAICEPWVRSLTGEGEPVFAAGALVSPDFFETFGAVPQYGRSFVQEDFLPESESSLILSHRFWTHRLGGDPDALGHSLTIDGTSFTIVGIMPADFVDFFDTGREFWAPLVLYPEDFSIERWIWGRYRLVARLADGVTPDMAGREMGDMADSIREALPGAFPDEWTLSVTTLNDRLRDPYRSTLLILFTATTFVLLLICSNLAGLLLARTVERRREISIRQALGAGWRRLLNQFLTEGLLLSLLGGLLGVVISWLCLQVVRQIAPTVLVRAASMVGFESLLAALSVSLLVGLAFGLTPLLQVRRGNLQRSLNEGSLASGSTHVAMRYRNVLMVVQFAVALILLTGAGLMIRSLGQIRRIDPGFETGDLLVVHLRLPPASYPDVLSQIGFSDRLLSAVEALPEVETAATTWGIPFTGNILKTVLTVEGGVTGTDSERTWGTLPSGEARIVSPGLPRTARIPILKGRFFRGSDDHDSMPVIVIDELMARLCWPEEDPLGKRITLHDPADPGAIWYTVIGIVPHVEYLALNAERNSQFYFNSRQVGGEDIGLMIRSRNDRAIVASSLRTIVDSIDPYLPLSNLVVMDDLIDRSIGDRRLLMLLLTLFGGLALFLASVGIYTIMSYLVGARLREMGLRMALGADRRVLFGLVIRQGLMIASIGLILGLAGAVALMRFLRDQLYEVSPFDPVTILGVVGLLLLTALAAVSLPGRRASRVDPVANLRVE
ncbi:ADOP family duplicated permease [Gemmatimonadota bacterium]